LLIGNEVDVSYKKGGVDMKVHLKPAKLIVIEGSHLFMSAEDTKNVSSLINLRVFIDSDSDVRLSRRVYQDTELSKKSLAESVATYLEFIKPSYEREIQQTKQTSDIIIPHFGGGFKDHKKDCTVILIQSDRITIRI
jgi:uridine kinase